MGGTSRTWKRVSLIVVGIGVVAALVLEGTARFRVEARYQAAVKTQKALQQQLAETREERSRLFEIVQLEQQKTEKLAQQLAAKDQQINEIMARLTQEEHAVRELRGKLADSQLNMDKLQDELAMALRTPDATAQASDKTIRLEKVMVASGNSAARGGHIVSVNPDWRFVVIDLGWNSVQIGDVVSIFRQQEFLGKARVERVQEDVAAATLLPEWIGAEIKVDDVVRVL